MIRARSRREKVIRMTREILEKEEQTVIASVGASERHSTGWAKIGAACVDCAKTAGDCKQ
jgi:hypothetical protein